MTKDRTYDMYHAIANLELMFDGQPDALRYAAACPVFRPAIPASAMPGEDKTTPRICVAPTVEQCVMALSPLGTFRRCLAANEDAKSYENDDEAYPVLVARFSDEAKYFAPTKDQVPDVDATGERWLLRPTRPIGITLEYLDAYAMTLGVDRRTAKPVCTGIRFVDDVTGCHHPWLDGLGHPLDCSDVGGDPWPDRRLAATQLWHDPHLGGNVGYAVPLSPFDGRCMFYPLDRAVSPYKSFMHALRRFSGFRDKDGRPVLDGTFAEYHGIRGSVRFLDGLAWTFVPLGAQAPFAVMPDDIGADGRIGSMSILDSDGIAIPEVF